MEIKTFTPPVAAAYLREIIINIDKMSEEDAKKELKLICNFFSKIMDSLPESSFSAVWLNK